MKKIAARTIETDVIWHASWHPDGTRIIVGYNGKKEVEEFDLKTGKLLHTYGQHHYGATGVQYNPAGTRVATSGYDHVIRIHPVRKTDEP